MLDSLGVSVGFFVTAHKAQPTRLAKPQKGAQHAFGARRAACPVLCRTVKVSAAPSYSAHLQLNTVPRVTLRTPEAYVTKKNV